MVPLSWYLALGAALFIIGTAGVLLRRNVLIVLLSLELMLNSVNINLVAFSNTLGDFRGQIIDGDVHEFTCFVGTMVQEAYREVDRNRGRGRQSMLPGRLRNR